MHRYKERKANYSCSFEVMFSLITANRMQQFVTMQNQFDWRDIS